MKNNAPRDERVTAQISIDWASVLVAVVLVLLVRSGLLASVPW